MRKAKVQVQVPSKEQQKIVALQSGFVFVGYVEPHPNNHELVRIREAYNIRVWGTTNGLGQLALEGTQSETVLDFCGVVSPHKHAVLFYIDCVTPVKPKGK